MAMAQQPAKVSYFFEKGYADLWATIKESWSRNIQSAKDQFAIAREKGCFSFGGGMATIPFLYDIAEKYSWFNKDLIVDMIAIAEATPGPVGVNMATFAGYNAAGILGAIVSTFSLVIPSLILVIFVVKILERFSNNKYLKEILVNLKPIVIGLIVAIFLEIFVVLLFRNNSMSIKNLDYKFILIFTALFILIRKKDVNLIVYFILAGCLGFIFN